MFPGAHEAGAPGPQEPGHLARGGSCDAVPAGCKVPRNSACAASGLNDLDQSFGQTALQVQAAADSWMYYGLAKGSPGTPGLCQGGTDERRTQREASERRWPGVPELS